MRKQGLIGVIWETRSVGGNSKQIMLSTYIKLFNNTFNEQKWQKYNCMKINNISRYIDMIKLNPISTRWKISRRGQITFLYRNHSVYVSSIIIVTQEKENPGCFGKRWSQDVIINKQYLSRYLDLYNAHLPLVNTTF